MNEKFYKKIAERVSDGEIKKITKAAEWIVDNECKSTEGVRLTGAHRQNVLESISLDMRNGAGLMKPQYMLTGAVIGCIGVSIILLVANKLKSKGSQK